MDIHELIIEMGSDEADRAIHRIAQSVIDAGRGRGGRYAWHYIGEEEASEIIKDGLSDLRRYLVNLRAHPSTIKADETLEADLLSFVRGFYDHYVVQGWGANDKRLTEARALIERAAA